MLVITVSNSFLIPQSAHSRTQILVAATTHHPTVPSAVPGASTSPVELLALQISRLAVPMIAVASVVLTAVPVLHVDISGAGGRGAAAELGQITLCVSSGTAQSVGSFELGGEHKVQPMASEH